MKSIDVVGTRSARDPNFIFPERREVTDKGIIGDEVTIRTVQGLGDIIWVYQKFAPYFRKLNFTIYITKDGDEVQRRCANWMRIFEQTGTVDFEVVPSKVYHKAAHHFYRLQDSLDDYKAGRPVEYAVNGWLDNGIKLDEIDPGAVVQHDINIKQTRLPTLPPEYLALYVSHGSAIVANQKNPSVGVWSCEQWAKFTRGFFDRLGYKLPIVLLGAKFDEHAMNQMVGLLKSDYEIQVMMGEPEDAVAGTLANAKYFIGYQSGLHILADILQTPQIIILFNCLRPMINTWCRQENIGNKFHAACFEDDPNIILDRACAAWRQQPPDMMGSLAPSALGDATK